VAQIYGNRWRVLGDLGRGGQGEVFRVRDETGQIPDECALKRIRNPRRRERFIAEVAAITRLRHPNIIQMIDHSALESSEAEKQYLVMPLAKGGNLAERAGMFAESLDSVLITARQLASALSVAHSSGVVHRDVKPENILFPDQANRPVLSDFGICLLSERERVTESAEVVGPWAFMAPELEGGGQLEVSGAVDVYSLGKLIYYMLSGGKVLPRERLAEVQYASVFEKGERRRLMRILLGRMLDQSPQTRVRISDVIAELQNIESWEKTARLAPLSPAAVATISRMRDRESEEQRITEENGRARGRETAKVQLIKESVRDWLRVDLEVTVTATNSPGLVECAVRELELGENTYLSLGGSDGAQVLNAIEFSLRRPRDIWGHIHAMRLLLCYPVRVQVSFAGRTRPEPERDVELMMVPFYHRDEKQQSGTFVWEGFLNARKSVNRGRGGREHVTRTFVGGDITLLRRFRASEWPAAKAALQELLSEALEVFFDYVESGASIIGP
jgi:serine/threonine protein kinase